MRASIDGKAVTFLPSPGIAHPMKSKVEFGGMGKDGFFDDLKIWNAESAKSSSMRGHGTLLTCASATFRSGRKAGNGSGYFLGPGAEAAGRCGRIF